MVRQIASVDEFKQVISQGTVVVDFYATWCGPCKMIAPFLEQLSKDYTSIQFIKVDVDELEEISSEAGVSAMPSFYVYKDGKVVDQLVGASKEKLEAMVKKFA
ncbi:cytosolic thioredoxin Trx1 [Brachionus plicatilis]|uniref:Thioredoxin n=1 Tax=Brachionus plicatilis TaxID=10195 RepID=A0A3M7QJM5_BRAPC|nr:cytosolic thioredoxin Trx1 [Brachionus plicatilis]